MYLMISHIPIYVDGNLFYTDVSWQLDLQLARDWLARSFGGLTLLAPSLPLGKADAQTLQLSRIGGGDGIKVVPSFDLRGRARSFWLRERKVWLADVRRELSNAKVIHTSASDVYRPLAFMAHREAVRSNVCTVLVGPDMDPHLTAPASIRGWGYCMVFDQFMQQAGRTADLVLLKEGVVHERYSQYGKNTKAFCHSMHSNRDVMGEAGLERRLATLGSNRPLRAVYAGRFIARKGLRDAISAIASARRLGANVEFDLFGGGPEEESLRRQVNQLGIAAYVRFRGVADYGKAFLAELSEFDLLLFLPNEEDTPRMLFDAMSAGLPLLGSNIPFLIHRVKVDEMGVLVDIGDHAAAAEHLCRFCKEPEQLKAFSRSARSRGHFHAVEQWYQRRAEWTIQAVERHALP